MQRVHIIMCDITFLTHYKSYSISLHIQDVHIIIFPTTFLYFFIIYNFYKKLEK
jgi:hypothetical protein